MGCLFCRYVSFSIEEKRLYCVLEWYYIACFEINIAFLQNDSHHGGFKQDNAIENKTTSLRLNFIAP